MSVKDYKTFVLTTDLILPSDKNMAAEEKKEDSATTLTQWEEFDGAYRGIGKTRNDLEPGLYRIQQSPSGLFFVKIATATNDLIRFDDSAVDEIMEEINIFWKSRDRYEKFDVQYKRGILMHGPPGSGKSSCIKMLINDVVSRGGIAIEFSDSESFQNGMTVLRKIHKQKPVVCIMEDVESILRHHHASSILNLLDGSTNFMDNIVFVATSNYPEMLEERIKDRPSRFDRVIEVGLPSDKMRKNYLEHLFKNAGISIRPLKKWVKDTAGLTFPHLQEMFLAVNLYDLPYEKALARVKNMSKSISSSKHKKGSLSFGDMLSESISKDEYYDDEDDEDYV